MLVWYMKLNISTVLCLKLLLDSGSQSVVQGHPGVPGLLGDSHTPPFFIGMSI